MTSRRWLVGGLALLAIGCGGSNDAPTAAPETSSTAASDVAPAPETGPGNGPADSSEPANAQSTPGLSNGSPIPTPGPEARPEVVVEAFLEATRRGDDRLAADMLTRRAIEETSRHGLSVQPPGSPTMSYEIERAEQGPNDDVYVKSLWKESFSDGQEQYEVVWILRQQPEGWRISGMAAQLAPDTDPIFIDFENPTDLADRVGQPPEESGGESGLADAVDEPAANNAQQPTNRVQR